MMNSNRTILSLIITIVISVSFHPVFATERIVWTKHPIQLTLPVGNERLVSFPHPVRVGIPMALSGKLTTQSLNGTVYWTANESFDRIRLQIQSTTDNQLYLIDLSASKDAETSDVAIVLPTTQPTPVADQASPTPHNASRPKHRNSRLDYLTLTRFAAQQLYAPQRLLTADPSIHRVRVSQTPTTQLIRGETIDATPIAAWRKGRLHVTAIRLKNLAQSTTILDPRDIRGRWQAATVQHATLKANGNCDDTTALYLISDHPYAKGF